MQPRIAMFMTALMIGMSWSLMTNDLDFQEPTSTTELAEPVVSAFTHGTGELISTTLNYRAVIWGDNITATINLSNLSSSVAYTVNWKVCLNNESTYNCTWPAQQWNGNGNGSLVDGSIMVQNGSTSISTNVSFQTSLTADNASYGRNTTMSFKAIITTTNGSGNNASHSFLTLGVDGMSSYPVWQVNNTQGNPPYLANGSTHDEYSGISLMADSTRSGWTEGVQFNFAWFVYDSVGYHASSGQDSTIDTMTCDGSWLYGCSSGSSWGNNGATSLNSGSGFSAGQYSVYVTMSENSTGYTMLAWNTTFTVQTAPVQTGNIAAWTDYTSYTQGDTVHATLSSWVSNLNETHYIDWVLEDSSGGTTDSGNFSWTSYSNSSSEYLNWSSLTASTYCLNATLYSSNWTSLYNDNTCFIVTAPAVTGYVSTWTNYTNYTVGDMVTVTTQSYSLTYNGTYSLVWNLTSANGVADSGIYNWTAMSNSSYEYEMWSTLSSGYYCINVNLYATSAMGNTHLDSDYSCFSISSPTGYIWAWTDYTTYTVGDTVSASMQSYSLTMNSDYEMYYNLTDSSGSVDNSWYIWTANYSTSTEYESWSSLASGFYCLNATLYDGNGNMLDSDTRCFTVSDPAATGSLYAWTDTSTYTVGDTVYLTMESYSLTYNASYSLYYELNLNGSSYLADIDNWTAYSNSSTENVNWSALPEGNYCLNATLRDATEDWSHHLDNYYFCFDVDAPIEPEGEIYVWTDSGEYDEDETITVTITAYGLMMNHSYQIGWHLNDSGILLDSGSEIFVSNGSYYYEFQLTNLSMSDYCIVVQLDGGGASLIDEDIACFDVDEVYNTGYVSAQWNHTSLDVGDTAELWVESSGLTIGTQYWLEVRLYDDVANQIELSQISWEATGEWSAELISIPNVQAGEYCANVTLYLNDTMQYLDDEYTCFWVQHEIPDGAISIDMDNETWYIGRAPASAIIEITDLESNTNYSYSWLVENEFGYSIWSHSMNFSSNDSTTVHVDFVDYGHLDEGRYCLFASLVDEVGNYIDSDAFCFSIEEMVPTGRLSVYLNGSMFETGDSVGGTFEYMDMSGDFDYRIEWSIDGLVNSSGSGPLMSFQVASGHVYQYRDWVIEMEGEYCLNATLYGLIPNDDGTTTDYILENADDCFSVYRPTPNGRLSLYSNSSYELNETVVVTFEYTNMSGDFHYQIEWLIEGVAGTDASQILVPAQVASGHVYQYRDFIFNTSGEYCINATLLGLFDGATGDKVHLDDDLVCFLVGMVDEEPAPLNREGDSDGDGVPDEWDNCADTPSGSMTDSNGCPPDVDAIAEAVEDGALPGFTSMLGVLSLLGAATAFRCKD